MSAEPRSVAQAAPRRRPTIAPPPVDARMALIQEGLVQALARIARRRF